MHIEKSGGSAEGMHVWPGSLHSSPDVTIPRQASAAVVQLGALSFWGTTIEGVHPCSVMASGAAVRDWTLSDCVQEGFGLMQSCAVQAPSHAAGPLKGLVAAPVLLQGLELAVRESGGAQLPEGDEQVHVPQEDEGALSPSWP